MDGQTQTDETLADAPPCSDQPASEVTTPLRSDQPAQDVTAPSCSAQTTMDATAPPRSPVVYIERQVQLRKFFGSEGNYTAEEFAVDIRRAWATHSGNDKHHMLELLRQNIGSIVAGELRCCAATIRNDPEKCLEVILKVFGDRRSSAELITTLLQLQQYPGESVREYSIRVNDAGTTLRNRQKALGEAETVPTLVRDQLINGLEDAVLLKFLKNKVYEQPTATFTDIRETALQWSEAGSTSSRKSQAVSAIAAAASNDVASQMMPVVQQMIERMEKMDARQNETERQLRDWLDQQRQSGNPDARSDQRRPREQHRRRPGWQERARCFRCDKLGHIARSCPTLTRQSGNE